MHIKEAIARQEHLKARRNRLTEKLSAFKDAVKFKGRLSANSVHGYHGDIDDICFTKEEVFGFLQSEVDRIDAELAKMKPVFDVANQALKSIFPE